MSASRPLRVLVMAPYYPPHVGGVERYAWELNEQLAAHPEVERVTVLAPRLPSSSPEREGGAHAVIRFPAREAVPNYPIPAVWRRRLWSILRGQARRHDVVVCHTRFFMPSLFALAMARLARKPLVHIEHGSDFVQLGGTPTGLVAAGYDRTLGRLVLRGATAVAAVSSAAAGFVERLAGREAVVVRRGVDPGEIDAIQPSAELRELAGGRLCVTFVGRLLASKGVTDLLEAFESLGRRDAVLCIVGEGPERAALEARAGPDVLFLGARSWHETIAMVKESAVVANPSHTEGLPTAVLEAAFAGRAIAATDVGGTREVVEHGASGLLVPARDPKALSRALEELLAEPALRARFGERARAAVVGRFRWDASVERFLALARSVLRGHSQQP